MPNSQWQTDWESVLGENITVVGARDAMDLTNKGGTKRGLGKVISRPDSGDLIAGIGVERLQGHPDDRGFYVELARVGAPGPAGQISQRGSQIQVSATRKYPNTIKAIHYHYRRTDLTAPPNGPANKAVVSNSELIV